MLFSRVLFRSLATFRNGEWWKQIDWKLVKMMRSSSDTVRNLGNFSIVFENPWSHRRIIVMIPKKSTCLEFIRPVFTLHPPELTTSTRIILKQCADFTSPLHLFIINCVYCIEVKFRRNPKRSPPPRLRWWYRYTLAPSHGPWSIGLRLWEGSKWSFNEDKHQQNRGCQAEWSSQTPHLF